MIEMMLVEAAGMLDGKLWGKDNGVDVQEQCSPWMGKSGHPHPCG